LGINNAADVNQSGNLQHGMPRWGWWTGGRYKYRMIRQYARKKDAPAKLKKEIVKLKKMEDKLKALLTEIKDFKKKIGAWGDLRKKMTKLRANKWRMSRNIRIRKMAIANFNIIPIIIAKKVIIP